MDFWEILGDCVDLLGFIGIHDLHGGSRDQPSCVQCEEQSGCRVHIERQTHEVRLYGPDENLKVADRLLKDAK